MIAQSIKTLVANIAKRYHVPIILSDDLAQVNPADPRRLVVGCQKADASPTDVSDDPHLKPIMDGDKRVASYSAFGVYLRFHPDGSDREALATRILEQCLPELAQNLSVRRKTNLMNGVKKACLSKRDALVAILRRNLGFYIVQADVLEPAVQAIMADAELDWLIPVPDAEGINSLSESLDDLVKLIPSYYTSFEISEIPGIFEGRIVGATQPIIIQHEDAVYRFAPYTVILDLEELTVSVCAGTATANGAIHPHVRRSETLIGGDLADLMRKMLLRDDLVRPFALMHLFLSHYNPATCCEPIENWTTIWRATDDPTIPAPMVSKSTPDVIMMLAIAAAERAGLTDLVADYQPQG